MHVVHARRARGHAGEARQAAVDVLDHLGGRRPVVLQHVLDQVDAPARGIELVAEQHIGRAGRGAEAAMHAGAQDLVGLRDVRIGELREGEGGLHSHARPHPPGVEHALRIEALLHAPGQGGERLRLRLEHRDGGAHARPARGSASHGRCRRRRCCTSAAPPSSRRRQREPDQAAGPVVEILGALARSRRRPRARASARSRCARATRSLAARTASRRAPTSRARATPPRRAPRARRTACSSASSARRAVRDRGRDAFEPQRRDRACPLRRATRAATGAGQMRRARHIVRPSPSRRSSRARPSRRRGRAPARVCSVSARGSTLTVTSVIAASVPQEPASTLHRS